MTLLSPLGLLLLGSIPILVILYVLKVRRQDQEVGSTFLWQQIARDLAAHEPWQRLRFNVLLILQLLLLLALTAAAAQPALPIESREGFRAILLDGSASMRATDGGPSRFELAKQQARQLIEEASDSAVTTLVLLKAQPELLVPATTSKHQLLAALAAARPSSSRGDVQDGLQLALSLTRDRRDGQIYLISDGAYDPPPAQPGTRVKFISVGGAANNRAITAFAPRPDPRAPGRYQLFARVANFSDQPATDVLSVQADGRQVERREVALGPGESSEFIFDQIPPGAQAIDGHLEGQDDFDLDNVAFALLRVERVRKVLLVSNGNVFIERALSLLPQVELFRVAPDRYRNEDPDQYDFLIYDNFFPRDLPRSGFLAINPPDTSFLPVEGTTDRPTVGSWQRDDPVLRYVDFSETRIARASQVTTPGWGRTIAAGAGYPLIIAGNLTGQPLVVTTFDFRQSNLPLQPGFPILMSNLVSFLSGAEGGGLGPVRAGNALTIPGDDATAELTVKKPDGSVAAIQARNKTFTFGDTDQPGVYTVSRTVGGRQLTVNSFAVNFLDATESNLRARASFGEGGDEAELTPGKREVWPPILLVGLGILVAEWWWYHRRA